MRKIILEILVLVWKALRVMLWKWLGPLLAKVVFFAMLAVGLVILLITIMR